MADAATVRNFYGRVRVEEGSMGHGLILVADGGRLGDIPIASVSVPFRTQEESRAIAEFFAGAWNAGKS